MEPVNDPALQHAIARMGIGLHAARLELPTAVADDLTQRWRDLLDAIEKTNRSHA
jgi:alkylation response protein AidB-like acyl-CoA dehydrogenase